MAHLLLSPLLFRQGECGKISAPWRIHFQPEVQGMFTHSDVACLGPYAFESIVIIDV